MNSSPSTDYDNGAKMKTFEKCAWSLYFDWLRASKNISDTPHPKRLGYVRDRALKDRLARWLQVLQAEAI